MAELLGYYIIISIVSLFGINIGLSMGLKKLNKAKILIYSIIYGMVLVITSIIANFASGYLYNIFNTYVPVIMGIIGILTVIGGIYTIGRWKQTKEDFDSELSLANLSSTVSCFVGSTSIFILLSKNTDFTYFIEISLVLAAVFIVLIILSFYISNFLRYAEKPYPLLLGNFMILNGLYFVIIALFIPTLKTLSSVQMDPLSIISSSSAIFLLMVGIGVFLLGVYLQTENITKLKYFYNK